MANILFVISNESTFGLYEGLSKKLLLEGHKAYFVDVNPFRGKPISKTIRNFVNEIDAYYVDYDINNYKKVRDRFYYCDKILRESEANLVVVPYEFNIYQIFILLAEFYGINSLHIQHALWDEGKFKENFHINLFANNSIKNDILPSKLHVIKKNILNSVRNILNIYKIVFKDIKKLLKEKRLNTWLIFKVVPKYHYRQAINIFPLYAKYVAVPSRFYKDMLINELGSRTKSKIIISGYMRTNLVNHTKAINLCEEFSIPSDVEIISYFYTPFHTFEDELVEEYSSLLALTDFINTVSDLLSDKKLFFLILMHPTRSQYIEETKQHLDNAEVGEFLVTTSKNMQGEIYRDSLIIGGVKSSSLIEARAVNTRVIKQCYVLNFNELDVSEKFSGIASVHDKDKLSEAISSVLTRHSSIECELVYQLFGDAYPHSEDELITVLKQKDII